MADLRALLYESWCEKCGGNAFSLSCEHAPREALATRLPECVPPGLVNDPVYGGKVTMIGWHVGICPLADAQAELLFIGQAVRVLTEKYDTQISFKGGQGDYLIEALAAALHRLADEREKVEA